MKKIFSFTQLEKSSKDCRKVALINDNSISLLIKNNSDICFVEDYSLNEISNSNTSEKNEVAILLNKFFKSIDNKLNYVIINTKFFTLVPDEIFVSTKPSIYLKSLFDFNESNYDIVYEKIDYLNNYLICAYDKWQNEIINNLEIETNRFNAISFLLKNNGTYVHLWNDNFILIVIKNRIPIFYNSFQFNSSKDFIYFLIASLRSVNIDLETEPVFFSGEIAPKSEIIQLVSKYIATIEFLQTRYKAPDENLIMHRYYFQLEVI